MDTVATQEITQEVNQEATTQAADALMAGFNKVRGDEPPAEDPPKTEEDVATPEAQATEQETALEQPAEEPQEEPVIAGFKESELKTLLGKVNEIDRLKESFESTTSKVYGKFGEIQRSFNELKKAAEAKPTGLAAAKLKRMEAEFPDLAQILTEDLNEIFAGPAAEEPPVVTPEEVKPEQAPDASASLEEKQAFERKLLKAAHPDWQTERKSPEFEPWLGTLPPEVSQAVRSSWDSEFLIDAFTAFKNWKADQAEKQAAAEAEAAAKQKNDKRLERAITPQGTGSSSPRIPNAADAMSAGFNRARGIKT